MPFSVTRTDFPEVLVLEPQLHGDDRGYFYESFNAREFRDATGLDRQFVQDNHSRSVKGVLRGLHYQSEQPQGKLVRVIEGAVFDVAVDIRRESPNFGKWVGVKLSADNRKQLWVPEGFAHGFLVMTDAAQFLYKVTDYYAPKYERTIKWDDSDIGIRWPLDGKPVLSKKDAAGANFAELLETASRA